MKNKKIFKAVATLLISSFMLASVGCGRGEKQHDPLVLPDYDAVDAGSFGISAWYAPEVTIEAFREYKECGFDYIFLMGHNVGSIGSARIEQALGYCDELGIKAFVDITKMLDSIDTYTPIYAQHPSFMGYNYDEPVIYKNSLNGADGLVDIGPVVEKFRKDYPDLEFLVNLNPSTSTSLPWGTPPFTYQEYIDAQLQYINSAYEGAECNNWISCDDYPLCYNDSVSQSYYLKTTWLENLEYLAVAKRDSGYKLTSNFFIQSMPYGTNDGLRNRVPTYNDIRLQVYTLLAFGYDCASYFCYATPSVGVEFNEQQVAMIDREGNQTPIYEAGKKVNAEVRGLENTYMQFNDNWQGVCAVYGINNTSKGDYYFNKTMDCLKKVLSVEQLSGVQSVVTDEDIIIGYMKDAQGNSGFMVVNYNDTTYGKKVNATIMFDGFTKADVYVAGVKQTIDLKDHKLDIHLVEGEGAFVIPHG